MRPEVISTSSLALDAALRVGGWPRGALVEVTGADTSGKTTLALHAVQACQRAGGMAAFLDIDQTFDAAYAADLGVNVERLLFSQPKSGEEALFTAKALVKSGGLHLLVVDTIAAIVPKAELAARVGNADPGTQRRLVEGAIRELFALAARTRTVVLCLNRPLKVRGREGWVDRSAGGTLLPSLATIRLGAACLEHDAEITRTRITIEKNAYLPLGAQAPDAPAPCTDLLLRWGHGLDRATDLLVAAFDLKVVGAEAGQFWFQGCQLGPFAAARAALLGPMGARLRRAVDEAAPWNRVALALPADAGSVV